MIGYDISRKQWGGAFLSRYRTYATYLKNKYGERVYKIPINLPLTCPNRDGKVAVGGCTFCGDVGAGFEAQSSKLNTQTQFEKNKARIEKRYKAKKYIAYFQNFTNTYMPLSTFEKRLEEACVKDVVEISISSRPDCIHSAYLDRLKDVSIRKGVDVSIEMGLQSVNPYTLEKINRGHGLAAWLDAVKQIQGYGFEICTHLIMNLPWDEDAHTDEAARILTAMDVRHVKLHSLYILKNTPLGNLYKRGEVDIISPEAYIERVVRFIRLVHPDTVFHRFLGRAPEDEALFCNWGMSWWRIKDAIDDRLEELNAHQGDMCDYLGGKAVQEYVNL